MGIENTSLPAEQKALLQETVNLVKWKVAMLKSLDTKTVLEQLRSQETQLQDALKAEQTFKANNRGLIAGAGEDCPQVKEKLAELWLKSDGMLTSDGKKAATIADREAWLRRQRTEDKILANIIARQNQVLGGLEGYRIDVENAKRKIEQTLAVIRLKTAQIEFLGRSF